MLRQRTEVGVISNDACKMKPSWSAVCCMALLSLVCLTALGEASIAQTGQSATVPASERAVSNHKIQELIQLLDDPEVRAALETGEPTAADPEQPAAVQIAAWENDIRGHLAEIVNAFPRIPGEAANTVRVVQAQINNHGFSTVLILFVGLLALGFGVEWLFRRTVLRTVHDSDRPPAGAAAELGPNLAASLLMEVAPVVIFALVSASVFLAFSWPPLLRLMVLTYLVAFIAFRLVAAISRIVLDPVVDAGVREDGASPRLLPLDDAEAHFWYRRLTIFTGYFLAAWATISLLSPLGFSDAARSLLAYLAGIGLVLLAIEIVWRRPGIEKAAQGSRARNWLLSIYLVALWGLWVAGLIGLLWLGIYALLLPRLLAVTGQAAASVAERQGASASSNSFRNVLIVRGARALVILLAVLWLALIWRLSPNALTDSDSATSRVMYGLLHGIIILLVADLLWHMAKAYIGRKLETATVDGSVSAAEAARRGRLRTLLPIFRNMLGVFIATVAVLIVLSGLGVQIARLIAGAGIFGVAIGFGSQTLVKDVISGVFYLLDDAFRVGEYIQSGSYKGTVESFSLRSVKLRHHRGPVFTVPFGELGAVQNMSRDWVIDKFMIRVPFDTDIQKVKKLVKGVGAELKADPELAPEILETVKMKGVEEIGDFGIQLSFAFMAKPGHQSVVRRRAYTMIQQAFAANGIQFAQPTVQVGGDEKSAAAAATTTAMMRQKAAEAVQA
jgi:moderate conductance mechanosensitive channel